MDERLYQSKQSHGIKYGNKIEKAVNIVAGYAEKETGCSGRDEEKQG